MPSMDTIDLSDDSDVEVLKGEPGIQGDEHVLQEIDQRLEEVSVLSTMSNTLVQA